MAKTRSRRVTSPDSIAFDRRIPLTGEINTERFEDLVERLNELNYESKQPILVQLSSLGGELHAGLAIYDSLVSSPAPVYVLATGAAMSMGSIILQAGVKRWATRNTSIMLHQLSYSSEAEKLLQMHHVLAFSKNQQDQLDTILCSRSKLSLEELDERTRGHDYYLTAEEALKVGLIDGIV